MKYILLTSLLTLTTVLTHAQTFEWATQFGGIDYDGSYSIDVDPQGNIYTTGNFKGTVDFDPGPNTYNLTSVGNANMFISKLDPLGNFIWVKQMGGAGNTTGNAIALDNLGNVYTTGIFNQTSDFDPSPNTYTLTAGGVLDNAFICKLDNSGNFLWAKSLTCTDRTVGQSITVDTLGNVYTLGEFLASTDFDPGTNTYNLTPAGNNDIFISKLDTAGNFIYAKQMGGTNSEYPKYIHSDNAGNVYACGHFYQTADFDPGPNTYNLTALGVGADIFVVKLDTAGDFQWAKQWGNGTAWSIKTDAAHNVYTTGGFFATVDFDPGAGIFNLTGANGSVYISKLDPLGNFVYAKQLGLGGGKSMDLDKFGNIYTIGTINDTSDFDPGPGVFTLYSPGLFISKLNNTGNFIWAKSIHGDTGYSLALDSMNNICSTGWFSTSGDFDPDTSTFTMTVAGARDAFVHKMSQCYHIATLTQTVCDSLTLNGQTYTSSGIYHQTLPLDSNCDSLIHLHLTITHASNDTLSQSACEYYLFNGQNYTTSGTYTQTLSNSGGCDSIVTLHLTINPSPNTTVSQNAQVLTANTPNATYQWLDCNGFVSIVGATVQTFTPSVNGNYAVIVAENACSDTSACYLVSGLGFEAIHANNDIRVYPNPSAGILMIEVGDVYDALEIKLYSAIGEELLSERFEGVLRVEMPELSGIYFVVVRVESGEVVVRKVVRE